MDSHGNCHLWQAPCEDPDNEEWVAEEHRIKSCLTKIGGNIPVPRLDNLPVPTALDKELDMHDLVVNAFKRAEHPVGDNMEEPDHGGSDNSREKIGDLDDDEEYQDAFVEFPEGNEEGNGGVCDKDPLRVNVGIDA